MAMHFAELDAITRQYMLREFEAEEANGRPYRGQKLTDNGRVAFPHLMRDAIIRGTEESLIAALARPEYWNLISTRSRNGTPYIQHANLHQKAAWLGLTEFNVWYVRGLSRRLLDEGHRWCQVYRAAPAIKHSQPCSAFEGRVVPTADVYAGHRAHYWPPPGNPYALMIPFGPSCHHTIRRIPPGTR